MSKTISAPAFALFGEPYEAPAYAVIHAEKLVERNHARGWNIPAHVHPDFDQLSILLSGECTYEHDGAAGSISAPSCVLTRAGCVHRFSYTPGSDGVVVSLSRDVPGGFGSADAAVPAAYARLTLSRRVVLSGNRTTDVIRQLCDLLCHHTASYHPNRFELLRHVLATLLLELAVFAPHRADPDKTRLHQSATTLFEQYLELVETEIGGLGQVRGIPRAQLTVAAFAARLGTTPQKLNIACQAIAGTGALALLQTAMANQATRLLLYTDEAIKEISYVLGYAHPSHFVRFFRQKKGLTPSEFRKRHINANSTDSAT